VVELGTKKSPAETEKSAKLPSFSKLGPGGFDAETIELAHWIAGLLSGAYPAKVFRAMLPAGPPEPHAAATDLLTDTKGAATDLQAGKKFSRNLSGSEPPNFCKKKLLRKKGPCNFGSYRGAAFDNLTPLQRLQAAAGLRPAPRPCRGASATFQRISLERGRAGVAWGNRLAEKGKFGAYP